MPDTNNRTKIIHKHEWQFANLHSGFSPFGEGKESTFVCYCGAIKEVVMFNEK